MCDLSFLIVGTQKGGTFPLLLNLNKHKDIFVADEIHFFDNKKHFSNGLKWYCGKVKDQWYKHDRKKKCIGEKTPEYMYHKEAIDRIHKWNPNIKIIICLRDPIKRAFSHWNMAIELASQYKKTNHDTIWTRHFTLNDKPIPFEHIVKRDIINMRMKRKTVDADCVQRGFYIDQIEYILSKFPRKNVHIVINEELKDDYEEYNKIFRFLGVKEYKVDVSFDNIHTYNQASSKMDEDIRKQLMNIYKPYNEKLFKFLGRRIQSWQ